MGKNEIGTKPMQRVAVFIIDLITHGYINKNEYMNKFVNKHGEDFSKNTFPRTVKIVKKNFKIPIIYNRKEERYEIDKENKKLRDSIFLKLYESKLPEFLSVNELLFFYSFVKSMITSEVYLPPTEEADGYDYQSMLRFLEKRLDPSQKYLSEKIEYKTNEQYKVKRGAFSNSIDMIMKSFKNKTLIKFSYLNKNKKENEKNRLVQPVKLVHYSGKWHLIAYCLKGKGIRNFNLSYIVHGIRPSNNKYLDEIPEPTYNNSFGIMAGEETNKATIRFYGDVAERMEEVIWQKDQKTTTGNCKERGIYTQFEFDAPSKFFDELVGQVLRFGFFAEIIGFPELREKWIGYISEMNRLYNKK